MKTCVKANDTLHHDNFHQVWCVVLRVVMCVHDLHLLVGSCYCGLNPFHPGQSGATFLFCECHLLVLCVITGCVFLWCWLIFVSGCAFICSLILHGVTSFWERGLDFVSDRFQLGKTYLGAVAMAGPGSILRLGLRYMHIGWSSIRHWLLVGWLLVIDQWSLIGYWLLIIHWLLICLWSTYCPSLTVIPQPHNHAQTHNTHLVKANKACKFIQIQ